MKTKVLLEWGEVRKNNKNKWPGVYFYFYPGDAQQMADYTASFFAMSSQGDGIYDEIVGDMLDVNGDGHVDNLDNELCLKVAECFSRHEGFRGD